MAFMLKQLDMSQVIEFVDKWPHLGHVISNDCDDMDVVLIIKRVQPCHTSYQSNM
jgi:hypothetical protein